MKFQLRTLSLWAALFSIVLFSVSCSKDAVICETLTGEWHYCSDDAEVYIAFADGGDYELFQKIGAGRYREYRGKWYLNKGILSGDYDGGPGWGSSYKVEVNSNQLILTALNGSEEVSIYQREAIPASVKESAIML